MKIIKTAAAAILGVTLALHATARAGQSFPPTANSNAQRQIIVNTTKDVAAQHGQVPRVTSEYRSNSAAHARGAADFSTRGMSDQARHDIARDTSAKLGNGYRAIVEEVHRPGPGQAGPSAQLNTTYQNGVKGNARWAPVTATATHIHVQPNK